MNHKGLHRVLRMAMFACIGLAFAACGAEDSSTYTPTVDVVETRGEIVFDTQIKVIKVTKAGKPSQSQIIESCSISFEETELAYGLPNNKQLQLGGDTFQFVRTLSKVAQVDGVPDEIFAVWSVPSETVGGITYQIEVEIQADTIIYRNTCSR